MTFPKKNFTLVLAVLAATAITSASALAAKPKPVPDYLANLAGLNNADYLACIKAKMKAPPAEHAVENNLIAIGCRADPKS